MTGEPLLCQNWRKSIWMAEGGYICGQEVTWSLDLKARFPQLLCETCLINTLKSAELRTIFTIQRISPKVGDLTF